MIPHPTFAHPIFILPLRITLPHRPAKSASAAIAIRNRPDAQVAPACPENCRRASLPAACEGKRPLRPQSSAARTVTQFAIVRLGSPGVRVARPSAILRASRRYLKKITGAELGAAPVRAVRTDLESDLLMTDVKNHSPRELQIVLPQTQKSGHQIIRLSANSHVLVNPEIHAAARRDRDFERGIRNSKITRARMNCPELRVNVGRELVELAERNHRPVSKGLRRDVGAVARSPPGVKLKSPA